MKKKRTYLTRSGEYSILKVYTTTTTKREWLRVPRKETCATFRTHQCQQIVNRVAERSHKLSVPSARIFAHKINLGQFPFPAALRKHQNSRDTFRRYNVIRKPAARALRELFFRAQETFFENVNLDGKKIH